MKPNFVEKWPLELLAIIVYRFLLCALLCVIAGVKQGGVNQCLHFIKNLVSHDVWQVKQFENKIETPIGIFTTQHTIISFHLLSF